MTTASVKHRQKGNDLFKEASGGGLAPVLKLDRLRQAREHYLKAYHAAEQARAKRSALKDKCSAAKNIFVSTCHISDVYLGERNQVDECLLELERFWCYGEEAVELGKKAMSASWTDAVADRMLGMKDEFCTHIQSWGYRERTRLLYRFSSVPTEQEIRVELLKKLVELYFHYAITSLADKDYRECLGVLGDIYTPLTTLEQKMGEDVELQEFVKAKQEDEFKTRCIAECMQKRNMAEKLLKECVFETELLDLDAIWQVVDLYQESILLTRENDVEQEAISLAELGKLYYRILFQKPRAKELLTRVTHLVLTLHPRNLNQEKWFQEATTILSAIRCEEDWKKEKKIKEARRKFLDLLKDELEMLNAKCDSLSIQKFLVWLYTTHPPKHGSRAFAVDLTSIGKAPGDELRKLLQKAIVFYHPDKIDVNTHGETYKVLCEEITKALNGSYSMMKGC